MEVFEEYLAKMDNLEHRARMKEIFAWVMEAFPELTPKIAWNQPMFTDHGTFIIGFSIATQHFAVAPERVGITRFSDEIVQAGYSHTKEIIRIKWDSPVDFSLFKKIIEFNMLDKADCTTFWRK